MNRFREPSTWAGIACLLSLARALVPPQYGILIDALIAATGSAAVVITEKR